MPKNNNAEISIVFFGSADFALPSIEQLHTNGFKLAALVTQPDRPVGRGKKLAQNNLKKWTTEHNIAVLQPEKINDLHFIERLKTIKPDLFVVAAYGKILPKALLTMPKFGAINVHGSLLPKYRGASPVQAAILNGESTTGTSIMLMNEGMDTGPVLQTTELAIEAADTGKSLSGKLAQLGASELIRVIPDWINGKIQPAPQNDDAASICRKISKQDGKIDWNADAITIERKIRAYHPWPSAWTQTTDADALKIIRAAIAGEKTNNIKAGSVYLSEKKVAVVCGNGTALFLDAVQPPGKKIMPAYDFLLGHRELLSSRFL